MPWVRLDDRFPSHRKVALLSDRAFRLYVSSLCWSSENLTEGLIRDEELRVIAHVRNTKAAAKELEDRNLWDRVEGGWQIHDFLIYNPDRAKVQAEREANAARQQAWRDRKKAEKEAETAAENAARDGARNGVTDEASRRSNDRNATRTRHDGDTNARENHLANQSPSQVSSFRNGVSNGTPAPAPSLTSTSYGSTDAAAGLPDQLADLKRAVAAAGLTGIAWHLRESQWEHTRQAVDRVGVNAMVAYAINSARLKGTPATAAAWIDGWRSLESAPETNGVTYLPAAVGAFPSRPSTTDQRVRDGLALADRLRAKEAAQAERRETS